MPPAMVEETPFAVAVAFCESVNVTPEKVDGDLIGGPRYCLADHRAPDDPEAEITAVPDQEMPESGFCLAGRYSGRISNRRERCGAAQCCRCCR